MIRPFAQAQMDTLKLVSKPVRNDIFFMNIKFKALNLIALDSLKIIIDKYIINYMTLRRITNKAQNELSNSVFLSKPSNDKEIRITDDSYYLGKGMGITVNREQSYLLDNDQTYKLLLNYSTRIEEQIDRIDRNIYPTLDILRNPSSYTLSPINNNSGDMDAVIKPSISVVGTININQSLEASPMGLVDSNQARSSRAIRTIAKSEEEILLDTIAAYYNKYPSLFKKCTISQILLREYKLHIFSKQEKLNFRRAIIEVITAEIKKL